MGLLGKAATGGWSCIKYLWEHLCGFLWFLKLAGKELWIKRVARTSPQYKKERLESIQQQDPRSFRKELREGYEIAPTRNETDIAVMWTESINKEDLISQLTSIIKDLLERDCPDQMKELGRVAIKYRNELIQLHRILIHFGHYTYGIRNPEKDYGEKLQIEDFAAQDRLHLWGEPKAMRDRRFRLYTAKKINFPPKDIYDVLKPDPRSKYENYEEEFAPPPPYKNFA
jgi:hypothetical protein